MDYTDFSCWEFENPPLFHSIRVLVYYPPTDLKFYFSVYKKAEGRKALDHLQPISLNPLNKKILRVPSPFVFHHLQRYSYSIPPPKKKSKNEFIIRLNKLWCGVFGVAEHEYDIHFAIWGIFEALYQDGFNITKML